MSLVSLRRSLTLMATAAFRVTTTKVSANDYAFISAVAFAMPLIGTNCILPGTFDDLIKMKPQSSHVDHANLLCL